MQAHGRRSAASKAGKPSLSPVPYLVFWRPSLNSVDLCSQLYEPLACSPNTSMQCAVFGIICLKVLLIGLLLFYAVDWFVLPARSTEVLPSFSLLL